MDFRLIDFHIYDETTSSDTTSSGSDGEGSDGGGGSGGGSGDKKQKKDTYFVIQMFGINTLGETASILIEDYQPFFYCKLPDTANQMYVTELLETMKRKMGYYKDDIVSAKLVLYNKLYGFTGGKKSKFAKFVFKNTVAMRKMKNLWYTYKDGDRRPEPFRFKSHVLTIYESNIPPLLRYFHIQNISPSGWVSLDKKKVMEPTVKTTTCTYEYICSCDSVNAAPEKETPVPYKICSFDIEASSSHGDFPVPVKSYKRLASNIVDVFQNEAAMYANNKNGLQKLFCSCVLTAFEIGKTKGNVIDIVYPIGGKISKEKATELIAEFMKHEVDMSNSNIQGSMQIESMFEEKYKEHVEAVYGDGDGDNDAGEEEQEDGGGEAAIKRKPSKPASNKKTKEIYGIIDLLLLDITRDDKIRFLTNAFEDAQFPKLEGDKVTFIGSTFMRYGEPEPYLNHCIVLGSCDPVEGAVIETVDEEVDLLTRWTQVIQEENPDIIIGYNIFGFDYEFMFRRAEENACTMDFLMLSRRRGELCANQTGGNDGNPSKIEIEHSKAVFASGEFDLRYFKMVGRLQIDMYCYFRRDFNLSSYKLDDVAGMFISDDISHIEYSLLDTTAGGQSYTGIGSAPAASVSDEKRTHLFPNTGSDEKRTHLFPNTGSDEKRTHLFTKNITGLHVGDFIHIEITKFTSDYYLDGKKFVVLDIIRGVERPDKKGKPVSYNVIVIDGHHEIGETSIKWTMSKDDVTPQDIFRLTKDGGPSGRARVAKYCIQDCNLVHHLMNKIDVMTGYVEMSRICSVPISFLVFRGQGIKLTSYVAKKCRDKDTLMPDLEKSGGNEGYEGAIVLPPKCAMYIDEPVACVDYSSLYPSSMISQNYSHDSKVWSREYNLAGELVRETGERGPGGTHLYDNLPGYEYIDVEFDTYEYRRKAATSAAVKMKVGRMIVRWAQLPNDQKSIMPSILEELLKARSDTRKLAKTVTDPFMENILDKRQLGYKVTANSLYGQCGSKTSTFYEKDVAACTTATGRMMITYARRIVEEVYGDRLYETVALGPIKCHAEYVYGDSVANYTPVKIRVQGQQIICTIEELGERYGGGNWLKCEEPGKQAKEFCELDGVESWTESGWTKVYRIIRHALVPHKKMVKIITEEGSEVDVTDDHSLLNPQGEEISPKQCQIGTELLSCQINGVPQCEKIKNIWTILTYKGFVYDLTTENHHFAAGVGNLIVHNTDSVFFTFNLEDPKTKEKIRGKPALEATIEIAQDVANLCTSFLKPPMALAYEKTLMPFILLSKKRYVGMLYEEDPNKGKLKFMGLSLKRRDACDYLKDTYGGILNILMDAATSSDTIQRATEFLKTSLQNLIESKVAMDKLAITKALRSDYKNPQSIAHRVLADRIGRRDPGNKPKPGDRIKYLFVTNPDKKALLGERVETPEFIISNHITIDYMYYITNQLMKPLQQLFGLAVEQILEQNMKQNKGRIEEYRKDIAVMKAETTSADGEWDIETYMKKKEKYCSIKIKNLLFEEFLQTIYNTRNGVRKITDMFPVVPKK
jgi:DNA polymerase elongation subunit (family B)